MIFNEEGDRQNTARKEKIYIYLEKCNKIYNMLKKRNLNCKATCEISRRTKELI